MKNGYLGKIICAVIIVGALTLLINWRIKVYVDAENQRINQLEATQLREQLVNNHIRDVENKLDRIKWEMFKRGIDINAPAQPDQLSPLQLLLKAAWIDFTHGEYDSAIEKYTKAIQLDPKSFEAFNNRATAYLFKNDLDDAISDFNLALLIDPTSQATYGLLAQAYYKKGDYSKVWECYYKAKKLGGGFNPEFFAALKKSSGRQE